MLFSTSVFGDDKQNYNNPIEAFSILVGPPAD